MAALHKMGIICPCKSWKLSPVLENSTERTPPRLGTLVHLKSLIYKHSIIVLIFQGTQRKAYKYIRLVLAAGIEPVKPEQAKRAQPAPLKYIYLFIYYSLLLFLKSQWLLVLRVPCTISKASCMPSQVQNLRVFLSKCV